MSQSQKVFDLVEDVYNPHKLNKQEQEAQMDLSSSPDAN